MIWERVRWEACARVCKLTLGGLFHLVTDVCVFYQEKSHYTYCKHKQVINLILEEAKDIWWRSYRLNVSCLLTLDVKYSQLAR